MKFDWSNYLKLAQILLDEVDASLNQVHDSTSTPVDPAIIEAKLRCLISRAYYSLFCLARNYLRDVEEDREVENWRDYNTKVHEYVMRRFFERREKDYKDIGTTLKRMRSIRNNVDYEDDIRYSIHGFFEKAQDAVESANHAIELLKKLENHQNQQK